MYTFGTRSYLQHIYSLFCNRSEEQVWVFEIEHIIFRTRSLKLDIRLLYLEVIVKSSMTISLNTKGDLFLLHSNSSSDATKLPILYSIIVLVSLE